MKRLPSILAATAAAVVMAGGMAIAQKSGQNGTTLAGYKTLDICAVDDNTWRYSGVITVWNSGAIDTVGFAVSDFIEYKPGNKWVKAFDVNIVYPVGFDGVIPAGTTKETATAFTYSEDGDPLEGFIRNNALLTITNHSGQLGKAFGPNPKATYEGDVPPPPCGDNGGCTYTQGYWGNKPDVVWPAPYARGDVFFLSGQTWQEVMDTPVNVSQGYYQLAHQYVAAVLNKANGAPVPIGVQTTLDLAAAWLAANSPSACTGPGSCGLQKDWAATLDLYNNGEYPEGPGHCE